MTFEEKQIYEKMSDDDKIRYDKELEAYIANYFEYITRIEKQKTNIEKALAQQSKKFKLVRVMKLYSKLLNKNRKVENVLKINKTKLNEKFNQIKANKKKKVLEKNKKLDKHAKLKRLFKLDDRMDEVVISKGNLNFINLDDFYDRKYIMENKDATDESEYQEDLSGHYEYDEEEDLEDESQTTQLLSRKRGNLPKKQKGESGRPDDDSSSAN
jgi:hypothetical protein